jgi:hypothetical protein
MVFLNINTKNYKEKDNTGKTKIDILNNMISKHKSKIFILYYMEGCGPCNATRPEWSKLHSILKKIENDDSVCVVDIDQKLSGEIKKLSPPNSFPTMRFVTDGGNKVENYEDSNIKNKDRSIDSFVEWINYETKHTTRHNKHKGGTKTKKNKKGVKSGGKKWTRKYKKSINCRKPKGFSQKQYCKYGRK